MPLLTNLRHHIILYFVERGAVALDGERDLQAVVANELRSLTDGLGFPIVPYWHGSILDDEVAWRRWGIPAIHCVSFGFVDRSRGKTMLDAILRHPPLGLLDSDLDAPNPSALSLPLGGIVLPGAVFRRGWDTPGVDRATGLRTVAFEREFDALVFESAWSWSDDREAAEVVDHMLLGLLARSFGRGYPSVSAGSGLPALVDHAAELLAARAYGAAGVVAGVAFERLMHRCLSAADQRRAAAARQPVTLATVINWVVRDRGWKRCRGRLDAYRILRNNLAHRLGDERDAGRLDDDTLFEQVDDLIGWLERQPLADTDVGRDLELVDVAPDPGISNAQLLAEALADGAAAAAEARTTPFSVAGERIEDGVDGAVRVIVRDARRRFTRWLASQPGASQVEGGVQLSAPHRSFERGLAWAHAVSTRLHAAGIRCSYVGRMT